MDVRYINPFIVASINAFTNFLQTEIKAQKPFLYDAGNSDLHYDVSGIIGLAGEVKGSVVVSFPKLAALKIVTRMTGVETKVFDDDVTDAVGELVNIVAGNAKKGLQQFRIEISLPSVVKGPQHRIAWMAGVPVITVPLSCEFGMVYLFVSIKEVGA